MQAGEHLWSIAARHLAATTAGPIDDATIAVHWRRLIALNLDALPSGDPDLVHPGDVVALPPIDAIAPQRRESNGNRPG